MQNKLRLGIDLDGVCADFSGAFRKLALEMFGKPDPPDKPQTTWDFGCWLSEEEMSKVYTRLDHTVNFWCQLKPLPNTDDLVEAQDEYELWFITNRRPVAGLDTQQQSCEWLASFFDIAFPQVAVVDGSKSPLIKALGLFAYIDDNTGHCYEVAQMPTTRFTTYLKHASYNADFPNEQRGIIRVPDLNTFLERMP